MSDFDWLRGLALPLSNFIMFFFGVVWLAREPLRRVLEGRREQFVRAATQARSERGAAEAALAKLEERLAGLDGELATMRARAVAAAEADAAALIAEGERMAAKIAADAERSIQASGDELKKRLEADLWDEIAAQVAAQLLESQGTDDHQVQHARRVQELASVQLMT